MSITGSSGEVSIFCHTKARQPKADTTDRGVRGARRSDIGYRGLR